MVEPARYSIGIEPEDYKGLSTDTKPVKDVANDSTFLELDTKKVWVFSELNINPITNNGWWEV